MSPSHRLAGTGHWPGRLFLKSGACGRARSRTVWRMILPVALLLAATLAAADPNDLATPTRNPGRSVEITGRATVIDGHTLWLPRAQVLVELAAIDSCELPQWSFDPKVSAAAPSPAPVACGALAKAWLTRLVADKRITCVIDRNVGTQVVAGVCRAGTVDAAGGLDETCGRRIRPIRLPRRAGTSHERASRNLANLCPRF